MDCKNARLLLEFARPGGSELEAADAEALRQHLAECPDCAAQAREERRADEHLGRAVRDVPVPAGLRERIHQRLAAERWARRRRWLVRGGAAAAALLLAGWLGYVWWFEQRPAVSAETVRLLADGRDRPSAQLVAAAFRQMGTPVPVPTQYNYALLRSYGLKLFDDQLVPHLYFLSPGEGEAHVYIVSPQQFDLQQSMRNLSSLSPGGARYTISVSYSADQDAIYLVFYTGDLGRLKTPLRKG